MHRLSDRERHPYRQIYRRSRVSPDVHQKAKQGVVIFAILVFAAAIAVLFLSRLLEHP
jgi:hypothetical protein